MLLQRLWENRENPEVSQELRRLLEHSLWWTVCGDAVRTDPGRLGAVVAGVPEEEDVGAWLEAQSHLPDPERLREALWAAAACGWALGAPPGELPQARRAELLDAVAAYWRATRLLPDTPLTTPVLPGAAEGELPDRLIRVGGLTAVRNDDMAGAFVALQALLLHGPVRAGRTVMAPVLFRVEDTASPLSATLTLRTVPGGPAGLFPDPAHMYGARAADDAFAGALTAAWQWVHRTRTARSCVLWSVTEGDKGTEAELRLRGASMGAPLALALERLLSRSLSGRVRRRLTSQRSGYAVTGDIDRGGRMRGVGGLAAKLTAARAEGWHVIAPEDNRREILAQAPSGVRVQHAADLRAARRQVDAVKKAVLAVSIVFGLLLASTGFFLYQRVQADESARTANREKTDQRLLAAAADARVRDPRLALRLGATALARGAPGARAALIGTLTSGQYAGTTGIPAGGSVLTAPRGELLASVHDDIVTLWRTGARPYRKSGTIKGAKGGFGTAFSADARTLAVTEESGAVVLWDINDPDRPKRRGPLALEGQRVEALGLALSPDGRLMAVSEADRHMGLWDVSRPSAPRLLGRTALQSGGFIDQLSFSADGKRMVTSAFDEQDPPASLAWDLSDPSRPRVGGLLGTAASMAVAAPRGNVAAVVDGLGRTRLWDVGDPGRPKALGAPLLDHKARVHTVAFSPDGKAMATGGADGRVVLHDVSSPGSPVKYATLEAHQEPVTSLDFSADGRFLISASGRQSLMWSTRPRSAPPILSAFDADASEAVLSPDRRTLLTSFLSGTLWDLDARGRATRRADLDEDLHVSAARFSPDGRLLVVLNTRDISRAIGSIEVYDVGGPGAILLSSTGRAAAADDEELVFSPDGRTVAIPDDQHRVGLWDLSDPRAPVETRSLTGQYTYLSMLQFSQDGSRLAGLGSDGTLTRWATASGELEQTLATARKLPSPHSDPEGNRIDFGPVVGKHLDAGRFVAQQEALDQVWAWRPGGKLAEGPSRRPGFFGTPDEGGLDLRGLRTVTADGRVAVTQGLNAQLRLWDLQDVASPVPLAEYAATDPAAGDLAEVLLSADGALLIETLQSKVQIRDVSELKRIADDPSAAACRLADGGLTSKQWATYLPGVAPQDPCAAGPED
ncbi:S16 family serine protease [Streptomyces cyaneofuscatus]|uniref:S16 family serine protease n=1 Tax=Streptomyces cyaneofuscatus TaxID=66883 RepID=UPI00381A3FBE